MQKINTIFEKNTIIKNFFISLKLSILKKLIIIKTIFGLLF